MMHKYILYSKIHSTRVISADGVNIIDGCLVFYREKDKTKEAIKGYAPGTWSDFELVE
jgi:hypothetical protein